VEKCAEAEGYVLDHLLAFGGKGADARKPFLSLKIEALRSELRSLTSPDKRREAILALLDELSPLAELRAVLAHSTMHRGLLDGVPVVFLKNASHRHPYLDSRVIISVEKLKAAFNKLSSITNQLGQARLSAIEA